MRADELEYDLPEALIAQQPANTREAARLLVMSRHASALRHLDIAALPELVKPALFVFNDTRVLRARLIGKKPSGGRFELLLVERTSEPGREESWLCMARPLKSLRPSMELQLDGLTITVGERASEALLAVTLRAQQGEVAQQIEALGELPLPPYIDRAVSVHDDERYQTVFARTPGAVAAPTAGLHFSEPLLARLREAGHELAYVTLHVGPGTFAPLASDELGGHVMHREHYEVPVATAEAIARAKRERRPVIAVGTTVVRTLEANAQTHGQVAAARDSTSIFIYPPYTFRVVDGLITNFHLPRSTLLALVMAFAGVDEVRAAYRAAVDQRYRFFSYGDAMFIAPREGT
jgi:S-adenosylmethionine:tRNA ribosyltransferase-isomerase